MPQSSKKIETSDPKKIDPPKTNWQKRLFDRTMGDPTGWLIISVAFFSLYLLLEFIFKR
jgi:hypothetical protein